MLPDGHRNWNGETLPVAPEIRKMLRCGFEIFLAGHQHFLQPDCPTLPCCFTFANLGCAAYQVS
jgi:hypothetical protein